MITLKNKKSIIKNLASGQNLIIEDEYLSLIDNGEEKKIVKFSQSCKNFLNELKRKGYKPIEAKIRFLVAWKGENDTDETMVILPNIKLTKL